MGAFTLEGCIGMGQFASVHRARRKGDGLRVALKLWHRPVALSWPGSPPGRPSAADRPQCDIEDVACFEQEVAMLKTCVAQPIEGLVKFVGYGFFSEDKLPEVRGFIVMELINGQDLRRVQARGEHEISAARIARCSSSVCCATFASSAMRARISFFTCRQARGEELSSSSSRRRRKEEEEEEVESRGVSSPRRRRPCRA